MAIVRNLKRSGALPATLGLAKNWIAADTARIANSVLAGIGNVMLDEATMAEAQSRRAKFFNFPERPRIAPSDGLPADIGITKRGQRTGRNIAVWLPSLSSHRLRRQPECTYERPSH